MSPGNEKGPGRQPRGRETDDATKLRAAEAVGNNLEPITLDESRRLIALEEVVARGKRTFIEVGEALGEIRDSRLYRADFECFEDYCREKWGFTRQHAYALIGASEVVRDLPPSMSTVVDTERAARELRKVPAEDRAAVVETAARGGKVTGPSIRRAARTVDVESKVLSLSDGVVPPASETPAECPPPGTRPLRATWMDAVEINSFFEGYNDADPRMRVAFIIKLLNSHQTVEVTNKAAFRKKVESWLERCVKESASK